MKTPDARHALTNQKRTKLKEKQGNNVNINQELECQITPNLCPPNFLVLWRTHHHNVIVFKISGLVFHINLYQNTSEMGGLYTAYKNVHLVGSSRYL